MLLQVKDGICSPTPSQEMVKVLARARSASSPGLDGLSFSFYKAFPSLWPKLRNFINHCYGDAVAQVLEEDGIATYTQRRVRMAQSSQTTVLLPLSAATIRCLQQYWWPASKVSCWNVDTSQGTRQGSPGGDQYMSPFSRWQAGPQDQILLHASWTLKKRV